VHFACEYTEPFEHGHTSHNVFRDIWLIVQLLLLQIHYIMLVPDGSVLVVLWNLLLLGKVSSLPFLMCFIFTKYAQSKKVT
jgi:hypothetical protein